jgi:hypothetical protein
MHALDECLQTMGSMRARDGWVHPSSGSLHATLGRTVQPKGSMRPNHGIDAGARGMGARKP